MAEERKQNKAENSSMRKGSIYDEFVEWTALPYGLRAETGIPDQNAFAKTHGVNKDTLTKWKQRAGFEEQVDKIQKSWGKDKTPDVVQAIYRAAVKGNASAQRLWLLYFTRFGEKIDKKAQEHVCFNEEDVFTLIRGFPKELQDKYYPMMRDLNTDAKAVHDKREKDFTTRPSPDGL